MQRVYYWNAVYDGLLVINVVHLFILGFIMNLKQLVKDNPAVSPKVLAELAGVHDATIRRWRYRLGLTGNIERPKQKPDSQTIRQHTKTVIRMKKAGYHVSEIAAHIGYSESHTKQLLLDNGHRDEKIIDKLEAMRDEIEKMLFDEGLNSRRVAERLGISYSAMTINLGRMGYHYCRKSKEWSKEAKVKPKVDSTINKLLHSAWG